MTSIQDDVKAVREALSRRLWDRNYTGKLKRILDRLERYEAALQNLSNSDCEYDCSRFKGSVICDCYVSRGREALEEK